jgi:hypothetical protein
MSKMRWSPELFGRGVYNDNGDFSMQNKTINPQVLNNILNESEK